MNNVPLRDILAALSYDKGHRVLISQPGLLPVTHHSQGLLSLENKSKQSLKLRFAQPKTILQHLFLKDQSVLVK